MNEIITWLAASAFAACLAASMLLDGPTELQATQDVAAEVAYLTGAVNEQGNTRPPLPRSNAANHLSHQPQRRPAHQSYAREMEQEMTPSDLYCIAMESKKAYELMPEICKMLATPYPPKLGDVAPILGVTELSKFIESVTGSPAAC